MKTQKEWFVDWFNSKYYHILYKDRDYTEAELFINNLLAYLVLDKQANILDLACGKGRHSVFLNKKGFKVDGVDLSENSINFAKQFENEYLHFAIHDMRNPFLNSYDLIVNLFTSFGYFKDDKTNIKVLQNIKNALKPNGIAVIDFLNINVVKQNLVAKETVIKDGIVFNITRKIENNVIIKNIKFTVQHKNYNFIEEVQGLTKETILNFFKIVGLSVKAVFGDYELTNFNLETSKRLIFIVEK